MHPAHHGLISNSFYDPSRQTHYRIGDRQTVQDEGWYGGIPLWVLAEQQEMLSASFYWVGSEAPVKGVFPSYYYKYNEVISMKERIKTVADWLSLPEEKRPHLITFYLPEVDHAGHAYGPESEEVKEAVLFVDGVIRQLIEAISPLNLPVNFIFVSDHGMTEVDTFNTLEIPVELTNSNKCTLVKSDVILQVYCEREEDVLSTYEQLRAKERGYKTFFKKDLPAHLHFGPEDDVFNRIGDIVVLAEWPNIFHYNSRPPSPGHHGYDPTVVKEMEATFYAWGPDFKKGLQIRSIHVVDVYDIVSTILDLGYTHATDGNKEISEHISNGK